MQHSVEWLSLLLRRCEKVFKKSPVSKFPFDKIHALREQVAASVAKIVEDYSLMTAGSEEPSHGSANIPGTAGNQDLHRK
jgi:hypothetical protein